MKTLSGKEFRKLFNRYETGFYLSEFEYLKDFDPLFPECVGKELKLGYKRKLMYGAKRMLRYMQNL